MWHDAYEEEASENPGEAASVEEAAQPSAASWDEGRGSSWGTSYYDTYVNEDEDWSVNAPELLPDFLQGWYLLADSNLTTQEKNLIQTAVAGDFGLMRIAQELRSQWPEDEEPNTSKMTAMSLLSEGMSDEGLALTQAEEEAEEALALIHQGKRTLKEARSKQHQIRMNRQYYKTKTYEARTSEKKAGIACFKCGGNHRIRDCPDRQAPTSQQASATDDAAPFVCFAQDSKHEDPETFQAMSCVGKERPVLTTAQAVAGGYGIIDGGATRTIGSTYALEAIASENYRKRQDGGILEVDPTNTPQFGFGNSSTDRCVSTAKMRIMADSKPGVLQVHALDKGQGPVLLSIATLRALKAVIDFESDLVVLRAIDDKKAIQAHRSQAGHQLLPLTEDLYKDAVACTKRVPSLREFIADSLGQLLPETPPGVERKGRGSVQVTGVESRDSTGVQSFGDSVFLGKTSNCQRNNTEQHDHSHQHDSSSMDPHRSELQAQVADGLDHLGETPPSSWTMVELKSRLAELKEEQGIPLKKGQNKTELQRWTIALNKASGKAFCQEQVGLTITGSETMDVLKRQALEKIYYLATPHATDGVGFGAHASLTYEEVKQQEPDYCQWVLTTAQEGKSSYRLSRLSQWLKMEMEEETKMKQQPKAAAKKSMASPAKSKAASSRSATSAASSMQMEMMNQMMSTLTALKEEVEQMREEKPHKKVANGKNCPGQEDADLWSCGPLWHDHPWARRLLPMSRHDLRCLSQT